MTFDGHFYLNVLCKNAVFPFLQLIPSPGEARGWGVVEALSYGKRGLGELRCAEQRSAKKVGKATPFEERDGLILLKGILCEKDGKILLNKFKRFGGIEKNIYLCTVKNASEGLKSALNAKSV